jgi:hypothetical protein
MGMLNPATDESSSTYEIRLRGEPPQALRRCFPTMTVFETRSETVLFRQIDDPAELDSLLDQLMSLGLVLTEVHELPTCEAAPTRERKAAHDTEL